MSERQVRPEGVGNYDSYVMMDYFPMDYKAWMYNIGLIVAAIAGLVYSTYMQRTAMHSMAPWNSLNSIFPDLFLSASWMMRCKI